MNEPLLPTQRQNIIVKSLKSNGTQSIRTLAEQLNVSLMTVRRDIRQLEEAGLVEKVRGGVSLPGFKETAVPLGLEARTGIEVPQKTAIAFQAAQRVENGMHIFIDAGTTMQALVNQLIGRTDLNAVTLVTNDIIAAASLVQVKNFLPIVVGGTLNTSVGATEGSAANRTISLYNYDIAFLSTTGWDVNSGVCCPNLDRRELKRTAISRSACSVLLADSSKYGKKNSVIYSQIEDFDSIITDKRLRSEIATEISSSGVELLTC